MRIYSIWDYIGFVIDTLHFVGLVTMLIGMIYLLIREFKINKNEHRINNR